MKHLLTLTLLCFGLMAQAQIPSYVPTNGLVGWWPFNGNANDESGNGNNGTVNGASLAADRFGNAGKAYSFSNSSINIPHSSSISTSNFTISAWVKLSTLNGHSFEVLTKGCDLGENYELLVYGSNNDSGAIETAIQFTDGSRSGTRGSGVPNNCLRRLNSNIWSLLTATYDVNSGYLIFYINGTPNCIDYLNRVPQQNSSPITIGREPCFNGREYFGLIDDIAIYNRALSASEVQQLYLGACAKPTFTAQPQNKSVAQGQTTTFAVQVDSASSFQWQMNLGLGAGWTNIPASALFSGDTTATITVEGRNPLDGARFRCIATSMCSDTSNAATLTVSSSASAAAGTVAGVPGLINYQGSALDSLGKPMKNQTIALKLSVLDSSSSGAAVYVESHTVATNGSGHFAIQIGGGTAMFGTFDSVGWANGRNKYLKTELSQNGTWVNLGTSQLVSVPYALHAGSAQTATTLRDSAGNVFSVGYSNGQPTLVAAPGSGSASNPGPFACGQSVTYARESYPTVQIGTQCWFQKNLNVGTMILGANDQTNNSILEKYCYNNDSANCAIYGGLYQWAETVQYQNGASNTTSPSPAFSGNVKGICPTGWHVPSDGEWSTLETFLGGINVAGGALKSTSKLWSSPSTIASNNSGFSALPGGYRETYGTFSNLGFYTYFYSSSESSVFNAFTSGLIYNFSNFFRDAVLSKNYGFSARCLKD